MKQAPAHGYILANWNQTGYRATAIAYLQREGVHTVENVDGNFYTLAQLKGATIDTTTNKTLMPPIMAYANYLSEASKKFNISINEARNRYGSYTEGDWETLLQTKKMYAIVSYQNFFIKGKLNKEETKLLNPKKKELYLSLGDDTVILKRFATKAELDTFYLSLKGMHRNHCGICA